MTISGVFVVVLVMAVVAAVRAAVVSAKTSDNLNSSALIKSLLADSDDDDPGPSKDIESYETEYVYNYENTYHYNYNYDAEYINALRYGNASTSGEKGTSDEKDYSFLNTEDLHSFNVSDSANMLLNSTVIKLDLMNRFSIPKTVYDVNNFDVYEIIRNAQQQGYTFSTEEEDILQEELMKTECVDINDNEIPGCRNKTLTASEFPYDKIRFLLWTIHNSNDNGFELIHERSPGYLNPLHHTYIIFHGFWNSGEVYWILLAKDGILKREPNANVIAVDWYSLAGFPSPYYKAVDNLYKVAEKTADLITYLSKIINLQTSKVSMVGHSLGAHCAGMTAKYIKQRSAAIKPISRITGLDPAGPSFFNKPSTLKLDKSDADFVDVIHTNGGIGVGVIRAFFTSTYGYLEPLGHVDFYPNGGSMQPGCWRLYLWCSHSHAYLYWLESITAEIPHVFAAWPCDSWNSFSNGKCHRCNGKCPQMGFSLKNTRMCGNYFLQTNKYMPYAQGNKPPKRTTRLFHHVAQIATATATVGNKGYNPFNHLDKNYIKSCN